MAYTTIDDPSAFFKVQLYSGNASAGRAIAFDDTDTDMQPDLVFIFARGGNEYPSLYDSARGTQKLLRLDNDDPPSTESGTDGVTAFSSDGFTIGGDENVNNTSETFVAWCWKESATAGFDIVTYSGSGSARTISHSLSAVPKFIVTFDRTDGSMNRNVYHAGNTSAPETDVLALNETNATSDSNIYWNDTAPTSSVFSLGTAGQVNDSGDDYVAYLFSEKQGYSKFGSYTGNGGSSGVNTADGTYVYTGFRPAWVMIKRTDSAQQWGIGDTKRDVDNPVQHHLFSESNQAEGGASSYNNFDILSNGFKCRSGEQWTNASGGTYIYIAFAEAPFVNSNGVPCNAR